MYQLATCDQIFEPKVPALTCMQRRYIQCIHVFYDVYHARNTVRVGGGGGGGVRLIGFVHTTSSGNSVRGTIIPRDLGPG